MVAPTATPETITLDEDAKISGTLVDNVTDPNNGMLTFENFDNAEGFNLGPNGIYTLDTTLPDYQSLAEGETTTITIGYGVQSDLDNTNGFGSSTLTFTITGKDDAPTFVGNKDGTVVEDDPIGIVTGGLNIVDVDNNANLNFITETDVDKTYGTFTIDATGNWIYQLDNTNPAVNALNTGETLTETITVAAVTGGTQTITITIRGNTDAAINTPPDILPRAVVVNEGTVTTVNLNDFAVDTDGDPIAFDLLGQIPLPTGVSLGANGIVTIDTTDPSYDALAEGDTQVITLQYSASDGINMPSLEQFQITVTGVNDAADITILTPQAVEVTEDSAVGNLTVSGQLDAGDVDTGESFFKVTPPVGVGTTLGTLTLTANGAYTYTVNNNLPAVQALNAGQTLQDTFIVETLDGTQATLTFTINGVNEPVVNTAPVVQPKAVTINEDATQIVDLAFTTVDADGDPLTYALISPGALPEGITINANNTVTVDTTGASYQSLRAGETRVIDLEYQAEDGINAASVAPFKITVTGVNDAADITILTPQAVEVTEDSAVGNLTVSGQLDAGDVDTGESFFKVTPPVGVGTTLGTLTLTANGAYTYTVNNNLPAVQALNAGQTLQDTFIVETLDGTQATLTFTINGVNEPVVNTAPVVQPKAVTINEDATQIVDLAFTTVDADGDPLTYALISPGALPEGITINANNTVTVDTTGASYQSLRAGETRVIDLEYLAEDGINAASVAPFKITVTGVNDAADISSPITTTVTEDLNVDANGKLVLTGKLTATDRDTGESSFQPGVIATIGNLGTLTFAANGDYTYSVDNSLAAVQALAAGQDHFDFFSVKSLDGTTKILSFAIKGADEPNRAPVAVADVTTATEDGAIVTGSVATNDSDPDAGNTLTYSLNAPVAGLTMLANGTYSFDPANAAYQSLKAGEQKAIVANYTVADQGGLSATSTLTITVTGTNDAADISDPVTTTVTEDLNVDANGRLVLTGKLTATDRDAGENSFQAGFGAQIGNLGTLTFAADGSYSYSVDNSRAEVQALAAGQQHVDSFIVQSLDGTLKTLTFVIKGADEPNRAPVAVADVTAAIEDAAVVTGSVATNDSDPDAGNTLTYSLNAPVAGLTLNANGSYSFDPANAAYQSLKAGEQKTIVANYTVADQGGLSATSNLTITVTGTNDAAVISDLAVNTVTEDLNVDANGKLVLTGTLTATDPDAGESTFLPDFIADAANLGALTFAADGSYRYSVDNSRAEVQALAAGQEHRDVFTIRSLDGTLKTLTFLIKGADDVNRAPVAVADVATAIEDGAVVTGSVATNDSDPDAGNTLTYSLNAPVAGLTLNADGSYSFDPANVAYQSLKAGEQKTIVANYTVADQGGLSATSTLTVTLTGVNDAAVIGTPPVSSVTEDVNVMGGILTATGKLPISDADAGEAAFLTTVTATGNAAARSVATVQAGVTPAAGTLGALTLAADGTYTYAVNNSAVQYLTAGHSKTETFTVRSVDGTTRDISFTINGADDAAVIGDPRRAQVTEDSCVNRNGMLTTSGRISIADPDAGQSSFQTTVVPAIDTLGMLTLRADGSYTYTVANSAVQFLGRGDTKVDSFTITSVDGTEKVVNFTINGRNDMAMIGDPVARVVTEDVAVDASGKLVASGKLSITDADADEAFFLTTVQGGRGNLGTLTLAADGSYSYSVSNDAVQYLRSGETRTDTFTVTSLDGTRKSISFDVRGANEAGQVAETLYHNLQSKTQHLTGHTGNDVFVVWGSSKDYNVGPAQDGKGVVIWNGKNFDVLHGFEVLRFTDKEFRADANGQFDIRGNAGGTTAETLFVNKAGTQWFHGTAAATDVFVVGANEAGYGYGKTQDGKGVVVWKSNDFDILYNIDVIRFNDHDVLTSTITH